MPFSVNQRYIKKVQRLLALSLYLKYLYYALKQIKVSPCSNNRRYRNHAAVYRHGVASDIVGAHVFDSVACLEIVVAIALLEHVGEVGRALVGQVYALYLVGDIYVEDGILIKQAVLDDEIIHRREILRCELLTVWECSKVV